MPFSGENNADTQLILSNQQVDVTGGAGASIISFYNGLAGSANNRRCNWDLNLQFDRLMIRCSVFSLTGGTASEIVSVLNGSDLASALQVEVTGLGNFFDRTTIIDYVATTTTGYLFDASGATGGSVRQPSVSHRSRFISA